jgi:hypothetical protein
MIGKIIHWLARISSVAMIGFFLLFFIGEGGFCILKLTVREAVMMASMLTMVYGLAEGWNNEKFGGLLTVGGLIAFYLSGRFFDGSLPTGPWFLALGFPGILYLVSWRLNK